METKKILDDLLEDIIQLEIDFNEMEFKQVKEKIILLREKLWNFTEKEQSQE